MSEDNFTMNEGEEFVVDFSEAIEFKIVEKGWYTVQVVAAEKGLNNKGKGQIQGRIKILDEGAFEGQQVFMNLQLSGRGSGITKSFLSAALGRIPQTGDSFTVSDFADVIVMAYISPRVYKVEDGGDGELRNNVNRWKAAEAGFKF